MKGTKSLFNNPKYQGKHVLVVNQNVYAVKTANEASRLFDKLVKETGMIPTVTFVPKAQSLILVCK
ncbi:hypothetical protein A2634_03795 [Candidatus Amesbacteria bacterium RIFCSPHIGHO2_01_FULL_48_32]|uniref:DUF5678 domain-containing protein n=1 Tax=Candidatus Amesbacteria bacterium RIFCSPLOWO2_01_FULL_48_25 TaxID=1797259 RepID=A0A1F4ZAR0_9BACT|nr:MAG: hypothetical protein A2634_03795 [Candidatus Amesbacteria bacterium RIFCSPHIGHO2_01_FULL_48_32]OGD03480.1 MAG: hypothetical protein A2989_02525 [Candidatus Amesbacteria bacterium RIFCSPLOWO2_01_FULL_48_25]HJZ05786.1 hypothetical protein [Patescibacteria group bacterium]